MKKRIALLLVLVMTLALFTGCAAKDTTEPKTTTEPEALEETAEPVELIVFAAASMTETLNQIAELYKEVAPNVTLVYNFDSSGTLKTQIEEGADCDVFISAAPKQMNALDASRDADGGNADGLDFVLQGTRINLLENKVALAVLGDIDRFRFIMRQIGDHAIVIAKRGRRFDNHGSTPPELFYDNSIRIIHRLQEVNVL